MLGDVERHVHRDFHALRLAFAHQDGHAGFDLRQVDLRRHAADDPRAQAVFKPLDGLRVAVRSRHQLLAGFKQSVENVEEVLLEASPSGEELDVVDHQHVHRPVALGRLLDVAGAHAVDDLVAEAFARQVDDVDVRRLGEDFVADGVHQMRLAEADAAVEKQRIVAADGLPRAARALLGHMAGRRFRHLVRLAGDERVEAELGVERMALRRWPHWHLGRRFAVFRGRAHMLPGALRFPQAGRSAADGHPHLPAAAFDQLLDALQVAPLDGLLDVAARRQERQVRAIEGDLQGPKPLVVFLRGERRAQLLQYRLPNVISPFLLLLSVVPHGSPAPIELLVRPAAPKTTGSDHFCRPP